MPENPTSGGSTSGSSSAPAASEKQEERYDVDTLVEASRALLGTGDSAFVHGALARAGRANQQTFTLDQAKAALKEHAKAPVEHDFTEAEA